MANEGLFETTYRGSQQAGESLGQGIQQVAGAFAQRAQEDKEQKTRVAGAIFGHLIDKGYIKPNQKMVSDASRILGLAGIDIQEPQTIQTLFSDPNIKKRIKDYETDESGRIKKLTWKTDEDIADEERKQKKFELESQKEGVGIQSEVIKTASPLSKALGMFGLGPVAEARQRLQSEALGKKTENSNSDKYGFVMGEKRYSKKLDKELTYIGDNQWQ